MIQLLKELGEPSKRAILMELRSGAKSVNELVQVTGMKQPNISNHLAKLRAKKIVTASKIGRQVYYSIATPDIEAVLIGMMERSAETEENSASLNEVAKQYAKAAISGNEQACSQMIDNLIRNHVPLARIYQDVLAASMLLVGKWYEVEAVDVAQEHIASAITERMMARVMHYSTPLRDHKGTALIGCVAGNHHSLGARMISDFIRMQGWRTIYLGPNVPNESFEKSIEEHRPDLVLLSLAFSDDRPNALDLIHTLTQLRSNGYRFALGIGGRQAGQHPEEFAEAGADFVSSDLDQFAKQILPALSQKPAKENPSKN